MSQSGPLSDNSTSAGDIETITGNTGGAVGPDASHNVDFTASGGFSVTGTPASNLLDLAPDGWTAGSVVFADSASSFSEDNTNFFWDDSGNALGIGTNSPDSTSVLDLVSTTKGFLVPRMTTVQKNAIGSPATGLEVYDTDLNDLQYYNGSSWVSSAGVTSITGTANQVFANGTSGTPQTGAVTLTLPQDIATSSTPEFAGGTFTGMVNFTNAAINALNIVGTVEPGIRIDNTAFTTWDIFSGGGGVSTFDNNLTFYDRDTGSYAYFTTSGLLYTLDGYAGDGGLSLNINAGDGNYLFGVDTSGTNTGIEVACLDTAGTVFMDWRVAGGNADYDMRFQRLTGANGAMYFLNRGTGTFVWSPSLIDTMYLSDDGLSLGTAVIDSSAILELSSTTQGFKVSSMTTAQKNAIGSPLAGLQVYDTDLNDLQYYNGSSWVSTGGVTSVTGTSNRITASPTTGDVVVDISATYVGQTSITTLGTITTGTWEGTTIAVDQGGTGQTSYTNGQLLIGNTTGNTLTKATLSAGDGIDITNGTGSISVAADINTTNLQFTTTEINTIQDIDTTASPQFTGLNLSGLTASQLVATDGSKNLVSVAGLDTFILGTTNQIDVADNLDGTVTLSLSSTIVTPGTLAINGMTTGSVLFIGASSVVSQDNSNFFWNDSNNRLGIGTTSPFTTLQIGTAPAAGFYDSQYSTNIQTNFRAYTTNWGTAAKTEHYVNLYLSGNQASSSFDIAGAIGFGGRNSAFGDYTVMYGRIGAQYLGNFYGGLVFQTMHDLNDGKLRTDMVIQNGDVGIGTTSPGSTLGINSNLSVGSTYSDLAAPSDGLIVEGRVGIKGSSLPTNSVLYINGAVGIGDGTNPAVLSTNGSDLFISGGSANQTIYIRPDGTGSGGTGGADAQWVFGTTTTDVYNATGTLYARWDATNGRLGIGNASPSYQFDVYKASSNTARIFSNTTSEAQSSFLIEGNATNGRGFQNISSAHTGFPIGHYAGDGPTRLRFTGQNQAANPLVSQFNLFTQSGILGLETINNKSGSAVYDIMNWDLLNARVSIGTGTPASTLQVYESTTATGSTAGVTIEQGSTGDSLCQWLLTGGQRWIAGIDNSDNDYWKLESGSALSSSAILTVSQGTPSGLWINKTSGNAALHVLGNGATVSLEGTTYTYAQLYPLGTASGVKARIGFVSASTATLTIANDYSSVANANMDFRTEDQMDFYIGGTSRTRITSGYTYINTYDHDSSSFGLTRVERGRFDTTSLSSPQTINFNATFGTTPTVVITGDETGGGFGSIKTDAVTTTTFTIAWTGIPAGSKIHWIAMGD